MSYLHRYPLYKRLAPIIVGLILCGGIGNPAVSALSEAREYEIKAVFLYNLLNFVYWPESFKPESMGPEINYRVCIFGENFFGDNLEIIAREQLNTKKSFAVQQLDQPDLAHVGELCHLVFISLSERHSYREILAGFSDYSILTVSDIPGFAQQGGMVEFYIEHNRVRLAVNLERVREVDLKMDAQLLSISKIVGE